MGGEFVNVGSPAVNRPFLASFDNIQGSATSWNPNGGGGIRAIAFRGNTIYVSGSNVSAFDSVTGAQIGRQPNSGGAWALAVDDDRIFIATVGTDSYSTRYPIPGQLNGFNVNTGLKDTCGILWELEVIAVIPRNGVVYAVRLLRPSGPSKDYVSIAAIRPETCRNQVFLALVAT
jgi:hypothetical protein